MSASLSAAPRPSDVRTRASSLPVTLLGNRGDLGTSGEFCQLSLSTPNTAWSRALNNSAVECRVLWNQITGIGKGLETTLVRCPLLVAGRTKPWRRGGNIAGRPFVGTLPAPFASLSMQHDLSTDLGEPESESESESGTLRVWCRVCASTE